MAWDGPLGVLINRASASASEIFAAAIQDYGRGVVIGERSFGKGTVQTLLSLDELVKSDTPKYGEVKLTIAEFFRVTGNSTQLHGVTPDIDLPSLLDAERIGESAFDNALAWSRIDAARFAPAGQVAEFVPALALRHQSRIAKDADYRYLLEDVVEMNALRNRKDISLNEAERRQERERQEARLKARDAALAKPGADATTPPPEAEAANPGDDGLLAGERSLAEELSSELAAAGKRDLLLEEASRIAAIWRNCCRARPPGRRERRAAPQKPRTDQKKRGWVMITQPLDVCAPGRIRTHDPLVRSQVLYPTELRALCKEAAL